MAFESAELAVEPLGRATYYARWALAGRRGQVRSALGRALAAVVGADALSEKSSCFKSQIRDFRLTGGAQGAEASSGGDFPSLRSRWLKFRRRGNAALRH